MAWADVEPERKRKASVEDAFAKLASALIARLRDDGMLLHMP